MIFPWLQGFLSWRQAPLTWTLIAINFLFFLLTFQAPNDVPNLSKKELLWAGRYYAEMNHEEIPVEPAALMLMGGRALRDPKFFEAVGTFEPKGDEVGFDLWKKRIVEFQSELEKRPVDLFGLQGVETRPLSWITYQFMHSGFVHLFGNMLMLLLFGAALERITGSFWLVGVYLVGGIAGALSYLVLSPISTAPMVGASASLSALMAFYALIERRKRVRFFYFLSPSPGYWGDIYLPTLVILPLYFVEDLASYLSTSTDLGAGVAYAAHMGGATFGIISAVAFRLLLIKFPRWERNLYASYSPSRNEAP